MMMMMVMKNGERIKLHNDSSNGANNNNNLSINNILSLIIKPFIFMGLGFTKSLLIYRWKHYCSFISWD
jgi:hypothetical protein